MALAAALYGFPIPINSDSLTSGAISVALWVGYLYLMRTLFRLPFALWDARRRYCHARVYYEMGRHDALLDGFYRGFLSRARWDKPTFAALERLAFIMFVWLPCNPDTGRLWVLGGGIFGLLLLLLLYLATGRFRGLVDDAWGGDAPAFRHIPNLRRPPPREF